MGALGREKVYASAGAKAERPWKRRTAETRVYAVSNDFRRPLHETLGLLVALPVTATLEAWLEGHLLHIDGNRDLETS